MKIIVSLLLIAFACTTSADGQASSDVAAGIHDQGVETIVCIRHGEKPRRGLGQLTCRGLNRALALPKVLLAKYGAPQFIFAPNPTQKVDLSISKAGYYYVRPLATIEPTAIRCGLPVNTQYGFREIRGLERELQRPEYQDSTVFVAWEHVLLDDFAKNIVKDNGGDPKQVPGWTNDEYDMIFVFKISVENGQRKFSFTVDHEGLNGLSDNYP